MARMDCSLCLVAASQLVKSSRYFFEEISKIFYSKARFFQLKDRVLSEREVAVFIIISPIEDGLSAQGILLSFPKFLGLPCLWGYILHIVLSYHLKPHECLVTKSLRFLSALLHRLRCCFDCRPLWCQRSTRPNLWGSVALLTIVCNAQIICPAITMASTPSWGYAP